MDFIVFEKILCAKTKKPLAVSDMTSPIEGQKCVREEQTLLGAREAKCPPHSKLLNS